LQKPPSINHSLRCRRLAAGITESQVAEKIAWIVAAQTGRDLAIDGNYVSKLERGVITWPNRAYRQAFRTLFNVMSDAELGFYPSRTRRDAERWLTPADGGGTLSIVHARQARRQGQANRLWRRKRNNKSEL
jgi:hypothetical protein